MNTVFVSGANGFVGSNLIKHLLSLDYAPKVIGCGRTQISDYDRRMLFGDSNFDMYYGDIFDYSFIDSIINKTEPDTIFHLASNAIVRVCDRSPIRCFETNIMGTVNILESSRQNGCVKSIVVMSCFDEETKVFSPDGSIKKYEELKVGEKVYSINPKTREIEEKVIKNIIIKDYNGKLCVFKNRKHEQVVTPNHRIYFYDGNVSWDYANNLSKYNFLWGNWKGKIDDKINILDYLTKKEIEINPQSSKNRHFIFGTKDLFYLVGIFLGDGFITRHINKVELKTILNKKSCESFRDKKGRFISPPEKYKNKDGIVTEIPSYGIFIDIPENDPAREKTENCLKRMGIKFQSYRGNAGEHLFFSSKYLFHFFSKLGDNCYNKFVPKWMLDYGYDYLDKLLDGLIDSDGNYAKSNRSLSTSSVKLVNATLDICMKLNLECGYSIKKDNGKSFIKERKITSRDSYVVWLSNKNKQRNKTKYYYKKESKDYKGKIWCVEVEDNHNLCLIRNNKIFFSGNSDKYYGNTIELPYHEEMCPQPIGMYEVSKTCCDFIARSFYKTFDLPVTIVRSANIFGPRDMNLSRIVPNSIRLLLKRKSPVIWQDVGEYEREFIYIDDLIEALFSLAEKIDISKGKAYNVGSGEVFKVKDFVELIGKVNNHVIKPELKQKDQEFKEIPKQYLSIKRIEQEIGWKPTWKGKKFKDALRKTFEWYEKYYKGK